MGTMKTNAKSCPDITDILERKAMGRVDLRGRSFAEKLDALDALRDRAGPLRTARTLLVSEHAEPDRQRGA
jgi:hypothetical protein